MYAAFFGFQREPFSIAPDPRFLFMSERHREALAHLLYGVGGGGGFVLLTGEIGAGKTTVGRCFLEQLPAHCDVAYVFNPRLSVTELLQTVCAEFGLSRPAAAGEGLKADVDALNDFLLRGHAQGRQALLVIDEAQSLSADVLEQLRLLTNLETSERKLLQIVLIGQPELRELLARPGLEQLAQRIIARYHLGPLSREETRGYVAHRLSVAGPAMPFEPTAVDALHRLSGGVPRRINLIADRALLGAYGQGRARVDRAVVQRAAREVLGTLPAAGSAAGRWPGWAVAASLSVAAVSLALAGWAWTRDGAAVISPVPTAAGAAIRPPDALANAVVPSATASAAADAAAAASSAAGGSVEGPALVATPGSDSVPPSQPAAAGAPLSSSQALAAVLTAAHGDAATAWRELALYWQVAIGEGEPCAAAAQAALACYRSAQGGLAALRQLDRPAMLVLRGAQGQRLHVVLAGLDDRQARLRVADQEALVDLPLLAGVWRGEFATLWRSPPGWRDGLDLVTQPDAWAWLAARLGAPPEATQAALRQRVAAFQLLHGLPPDGVVGPLTLMRLNRGSDIDEPRLSAHTSR